MMIEASRMVLTSVLLGALIGSAITAIRLSLGGSKDAKSSLNLRSSEDLSKSKETRQLGLLIDVFGEEMREFDDEEVAGDGLGDDEEVPAILSAIDANFNATNEAFGPLDYVGSAGSYSAPYPLGVCQGDCNKDADCSDGLYCFQRGAFQDIPGCTGGNDFASTADFCVWDGSLPMPKPKPASNNTLEEVTVKPTFPPTTTEPTFAPTLPPTTAPTTAPTSAPSSSPTAQPTASPTNAPTYEPFGNLTYVGNDGSGYYAPYPLGVCQGDCDTDADCANGLYCFQRTRYEAVPGCMGGSRLAATADFCVWDEESPKPGVPEVYEFGELEYVGNDGTWYAPYPLRVCLGDCDSDADCAEGLFCYDRSPYDVVPGCAGGKEDTTTADICVWNTSYPLPPPLPEPPSDAFRLKLYWQQGYLWQNETFEREWCMSHDFDGYPGTGGCWYDREFRNCSSDELYMALCVDADPRQWFTFENLGTAYNRDSEQEVLIKTSERLPRCLARRSSDLYLTRNCNPNDMTQRFFALRGSFWGFRFELGQYQGYTHENCVTNAHHPKSGEVVEFHICDESRKEHDETSYWEYF